MFYNTYSDQFLKQKEAENTKKQILFPFLDHITSPSELFRVFSKLINIPSFMIEVHREVDQKVISKDSEGSQISKIFLNSQINCNQ
jgi:hypothetical protein